jgi:hypothetical protein
MRTLAALSLLVFAACAESGTTPVATDPGGPAVAGPSFDLENSWIVVLADGVDPRAVVSESGAQVRFVYRTVLNGFAAELTPAQVAELRADPAVAYVERDGAARLMTTQFNATWGIDRIDQADLPLSTTFTFNARGTGVVAYVLDTGVRRTHVDFGGRANYIPNGANGDFVGDGYGSAEDCHGHGTHVAGTIGSTTYGVAKNVLIRAGRVTNCSGNGTASMVIAAMDWIGANGTKPAVVNMSLGYGNVQSVRDAAERLVRRGFFVTAAAGNGNFAGVPENACLQSPAGAPHVLTVGSTTSTDNESSFSNYGPCVDLLAPGSAVVSLDDASDTATGTRSGTSMAAPHAAGVGAQYLQIVPFATPWAVHDALKNAATTGTIVLHAASVNNGTPNRFLFTSY